MKKGLFLWIWCLCLSVMMTTVAIAETVYVTKYGKKYHKVDSAYLDGREVIELTIEEAEEQGYKPSRDFLEEEMDEETTKKTSKKKKKKAKSAE